MTADQDLSARLLPCPFCGGEALHIFASAGMIACRGCGAETATLKTRDDAVAAWNRRNDRDAQAAVAKAVEAERARVKAAEWETPDHTTMAHMLGMSAAELSVDLCRLGLFPAVGVDDTGEFVLGPFWLKDGEVIHGSASVHWSAGDRHYYWSAYIDFGTEQIRGHWPIDTIPDELAAAIRSRGVAG